MQLIVGLGNPGREYEDTRHNLGYLVVDELARRHGLAFGAGTPRYALAAGELAGGRAVLLKPLTYMNRSGGALREWAARAGERVGAAAGAGAIVPVIVCDDIALPLGSLRVRAGGSAGGHRGLESIIAALGGGDFPRVRLGCAGGDGRVPPEQWSDYVLDRIPKDERQVVEELVVYAADAVEFLLEAGPAAAAARYNRTVRPGAP